MEETGRGDARDRPMNVGDSLAELLATGLRRRDGIQREDWERTGGGRLSLHTFLDGLHTPGLQRNEDSFWLESKALNIIDSILPSMYLHLMKKLDDEQTSK